MIKEEFETFIKENFKPEEIELVPVEKSAEFIEDVFSGENIKIFTMNGFTNPTNVKKLLLLISETKQWKDNIILVKCSIVNQGFMNKLYHNNKFSPDDIERFLYKDSIATTYNPPIDSFSIYSIDRHFILNMDKCFEQIPLEFFTKNNVNKTILKKLILKKYYKVDDLNTYKTAKKLYKEGIGEFLYLFGKDRTRVPNSKELYELISDEHFKSRKNQAMNNGSVFYGNVAAVFNYYYKLFNKKIVDYFRSIMKNTENNKFYYEDAMSMDNILGRFRKLAKKDKTVYESLPDDLKLLLEIQ